MNVPALHTVRSRPPSIGDSEAFAGWMRRARPLRPGEPVRGLEGPEPLFHFVRSGFLARSRLLGDGRRQITAILLAGDHHPPLEPAHAPNLTLSALGASMVASVPVAEVEEARARCATVRAMLADGERRRRAMAEEHLVSLGQRSALERIGHLFCEILVRSGEAESGADCPFPITQADLADTMGLSVVHTNRIIQTLRRRALAEVARGRLKVLDLPALAHLSAFHEDYLA